ncbi:hypothetical protein L208DRAFT_1278438, partial [Tricholoma matsutake]
TLAWTGFIALLEKYKETAFELHTAVVLDYETLDMPEQSEDHCHVLAQHLAKAIWNATGFQFNLTTYTFYCAQFEGEQTKKKLTETGKHRARMTMDHYKCSS